jgi:hypothetical protein
LLAVAVVIGLKTAPRLAIRSSLLDRVVHDTPIVPQLRRDVGTAVRWGLVAGVAIVVLQLGFGFLVDELAPQTGSGTLRAILSTIRIRFLYGAITEELLLRWGFMSLVGFGLWATLDRGRVTPSARTMWTAVVVAAFVFALGHLPAAATTFTLTPSLVAYIVVGNSVGGIVFGWLFWKRSLKAAKISHASVHVVLITVSLASLFI